MKKPGKVIPLRGGVTSIEIEVFSEPPHPMAQGYEGVEFVFRADLGGYVRKSDDDRLRSCLGDSGKISRKVVRGESRVTFGWN